MGARAKFFAGLIIGLTLSLSAGLQAQVGGPLIGPSSGSSYDPSNVSITGGSAQFSSGSCGTAPSIAFSSETNLGLYRSGSGQMSLCTSSGTEGLRFQAGIISIIDNTGILRFGAAADTILGRGASAGQFKFGTTSTSPTQIMTLQTTAPTCSASCGTSPSVVGSDTAGTVTMGASGVPASPFTITFNGTWANAPACTVQSALATMVVGKMPIAVATTTTTIQVTTNGTAPATSDKYQFICVGR